MLLKSPATCSKHATAILHRPKLAGDTTRFRFSHGQQLPQRAQRSTSFGRCSAGSNTAAQYILPAYPANTASCTGFASKAEVVVKLLRAKEASGKSFSQIAGEVGLTNVYCTQLFYNQQQLQPNTAAALQKAVPALTPMDLEIMMRAPMRSFDPASIQEPSIYRLYEAIMHNGEAIKALINEEFGDGIMSAIDFYCSLDKMEGTQGERRVVITFNGKFLPYVEQRLQDNVAQQQVPCNT